MNVETKTKKQFMYTKFSELIVFMYWPGKLMNNLLSYCGLVDPRIRASEKDLPVLFTRFLQCSERFYNMNNFGLFWWYYLFFPLLVTCQPINNINPMWSGNGPIKTIDSPGYAEALRMAQAEDETLGIRNIYGTRSSKE